MDLLWVILSKFFFLFGILCSQSLSLGDAANGGVAAASSSKIMLSLMDIKQGLFDVPKSEVMTIKVKSLFWPERYSSQNERVFSTEERTGRKRRSYQNVNMKERFPYSVTIPPDYLIVVCLGVSVHSLLNETSLELLKQAFASYLNLPPNNVCIDKIRYNGNMVEMYFVKKGHPFNTKEDLIPANQVIRTDLLSYLQKTLPSLNITIVSSQHKFLITTYESPFWLESYFPYVAAACSVSLVLITSVMVYCCCKKNVKDKVVTETEEESKSQQILYPLIKPDVKNPVMIQPEGTPVFTKKGACLQTQAKKLKAKGLLERRGSSASLKIDLSAASQEANRWEGTPPKEGTGIEYLLTAGHRLSRRDLHNAMKNNRALYAEFWEVPMNHPEKVHVAGSGMKNRYRTIIPNEHSRVILPDSEWDPLSSYINANYIRGYDGEEKAYIATQGPMSHTIVDFWRMVWTEKSPIIVMITKLKEKSKPKCENYLPDDSEKWCAFGDIDVKVDRIINKQGYILRHLLLRSQGEVQHVLHYWYTAWPDHKPTQSPHMLLQLIQEVELRRYRGDRVRVKGPVVVHCSAGIGRTGCFIAISTGMHQLREEHSVDVLGIVCNLRIDRGGMIQTHEQYEFIHQALCEYEKDLEEPLSNGQPVQ